MLNICLIGGGGVGTIASLVLEKSGRAKVTAVLRSNYEIVTQKGFEIDSIDHGKLPSWRPSRIVSSIAEAVQYGPYDFVVVTMKALPDVYSLPILVEPVITKGVTGIVLIQNGLNIEMPLAEAFPENVIMSGVSMIGSRMTGNVVYHEDPDDSFMGPYIHSGLSRENQMEKARLFVEVYSAGGAAKCVLTDDITRARWRKLLWNGTFNTLCTLTRLDVGALQRGGGTESLLRPAMKEMLKVANGAGYEFPAELVDEMIEGTPPTSPFKPSMLVDLEKGNPLELEVILGAPLRVARGLNLETPILTMVYEALKIVQWGILQQKK
ncbi:hypothetical protein BP6252_07532 [Coleophoma cylindrospora]|uniref:2-dehydropantoate 2-reductase n=1 Tax=Coleophoma cylindrospora TaxID=1849047 RepID=A0A3D8RA94_9HELO|nr:hypothetical protein BP6252_07532 [Coleophoma cylindrospora]